MSEVIHMRLQDVVLTGGGGGGSDAIWLPSVDASGNISWTRSTSTTAPETRNIKGPAGADGQNGQDGAPGADGSDGADGIGITSIEKTSTSGLVDTYTITFTDGNTTTFTVTNGANGQNGQNGQDGQDGADGLGIKSVAINGSNHLIVTFDDDTTEDAGEIDVTVPIDDTTAANNTVYSSAKVEDEFYQYEKDVTTRKLNITPDMEVINVSSTDTAYLFANENVAYISDIAENENKGVTYKVKDGLIYANGTVSSTFYVDVDIVLPSNWAGSSVIGTIEIVSGTVTTQNIKLKLPGTYMSSGTEKQISYGQGSYVSYQMISVTNAQAQIQFSGSAVCTNAVLRPYFALRNDANQSQSITPRPTAARSVVSGTIKNTTGILMTMSADFTAHVKSRKPLSVLFGKRMALCGDSIAYGHSGDSFGYTIAEKENMAFDKLAWGTARMADSSPVISVKDQVTGLTKGYDYILVEGGINDALNGVTLGSLTSGFDAVLDTTTAMGALETICKTLVENYPNAKKLFVLCHKCTNKNCVPYDVQDTFFAGMITALEKWNIPYIDIRKFPLCAYNATIGAAYFGSDFGSGGSLHPNHAGYALGYVDQITAKLKEI